MLCHLDQPAVTFFMKKIESASNVSDYKTGLLFRQVSTLLNCLKQGTTFHLLKHQQEPVNRNSKLGNFNYILQQTKLNEYQ